MNDRDYREALDAAAERGRTRGADAVFAAASTRATGSSEPPSSRSATGRRVLVAAVALVVISAGATIAVRARTDNQMVSTSPGPSSGHRYRVTTTDDVHVLGPDGKPDPGARTVQLTATIRTRLHNLALDDATVDTDPGGGATVTVPDTVPAATVHLLLGTVGALYVDVLNGQTNDDLCGARYLSPTIADRSGQWPDWGPVTACHSTTQSVPAGLIMTGRDPNRVITAPGAAVELQPNGPTTDVVVKFPPVPMGTIVPSYCDDLNKCPRVTSPTTAPETQAVVFDNTIVGPTQTTTPTGATFARLSPADARVLQAILLSNPYMGQVTVTDLDAPPDTNTPPTPATQPR